MDMDLKDYPKGFDEKVRAEFEASFKKLEDEGVLQKPARREVYKSRRLGSASEPVLTARALFKRLTSN
jgi:hypothetical protein